MSPVFVGGCGRLGSFPRVSGDEPEDPASAYSFQAFSPRERG